MKPEWMEAIKAPNPETLVDRLNGIYPSAVGPYATSPLQKEAAAEIERLRMIVKGSACGHSALAMCNECGMCYDCMK